MSHCPLPYLSYLIVSVVKNVILEKVKVKKLTPFDILLLSISVTSKKLPYVYESCPKMISL